MNTSTFLNNLGVDTSKPAILKDENDSFDPEETLEHWSSELKKPKESKEVFRASVTSIGFGKIGNEFITSQRSGTDLTPLLNKAELIQKNEIMTGDTFNVFGQSVCVTSKHSDGVTLTVDYEVNNRYNITLIF